MSAQNDIQNSVAARLILDTNILQYYSNSRIRPSLEIFLKNISEPNNIEYWISQITVCELLSGTTINQEAKALEQLGVLKQYAIENTTLIASARLVNLYKDQNIQDQQISISDRIIAATSILTGNPILTANVNDFPRPYFIEVYRHLLTYQKSNTTQSICLQILSPDIDLINEKFNHRKK
jgi:predicted nucleic acid-binding protein